MRRLRSSKSDTCTERWWVYAADISVKVGAHYPGDLAEKSAAARPWERKFLGYSLTWHGESRLKVAMSSVLRLTEKLREIFRRGRGRNLARLIEAELTPLLRGWMNYFRLAEVKGIFEELDSWGYAANYLVLSGADGSDLMLARKA
jgi:Group II intron, maturase-specific domain